MERYSADAGDRIGVEWPAGRLAPDDLVLTVDGSADPSSGVLTTAAGADTVHRLFREGVAFDLRVTPADERSPRAFTGCTLVSSSGKWVESA